MSAASEDRKLEMALYEKEFLLNKSKLVSIERVSEIVGLPFPVKNNIYAKKTFPLNRASLYYSPSPKETFLKCFQKKQVYAKGFIPSAFSM